MRFLLFIVAALILPFVTAQAEDITEQELLGHIEILASDDFGGRKPGTHGENKTVNYIASQWKKAGLSPASKKSTWYAPVAMIDRTPVSQEIGFILQNKRKRQIRIDDDYILLRGAVAKSRLSNVEIVHTGFGSASVDEMRPLVSGKLAFLFLRSPPATAGFPSYRERKANIMAAGASGVIAIVKGKARWDRSLKRYRSANTSLDDEASHALVEGIISARAAEKLFRKAGIDVKKLAIDTESKEFRPLELPVIGNLSVQTHTRSYNSHNVIGKIAGSNPKSGALLFLGHWDHFGECQPDSQEDRICNGAVDNASGISLLIETAKRLVGDSLDRDVYFLATTAEERGLLGAKAFVADPGFALNRLVAVFNADTIALAPEGKMIAVVGRGKTDLDSDIEKIAQIEGREIDQTDKPNAYLKRQDAYAFLEKGIPAFMITSAFADEERLAAYLGGRYHDVSDEADEGLILGGAAADANFHVALGRYFGNIATYPQKPTSEPANN